MKKSEHKELIDGLVDALEEAKENKDINQLLGSLSGYFLCIGCKEVTDKMFEVIDVLMEGEE